jgi:hypothetical protein
VSRVPRRSSSGLIPATPIATVGRADAPRAAERVADDDGRRDAEAGGERVADERRGCVRVPRQEDDPAVAGGVGAVDARARADEAVLRLGDHEVAAAAADSPGLPEHRGDVVGSSLDAAFGLRDRLLGDDEDIAALQAADALDRIAENAPRSTPGSSSGSPSSGRILISLSARRRPRPSAPACAAGRHG